MSVPMDYLGCGALGVITLGLVLQYLLKRDQFVRLRSEDIEDIGRVVELAMSNALEPMRVHMESTNRRLSVISARLKISDADSNGAVDAPRGGAA